MQFLDERLKHVDSELEKYRQENQELHRRLSECEEYIDNSKANTQTFLERLNHDIKKEYDPFMCSCHELKVEGFPSDYK